MKKALLIIVPLILLISLACNVNFDLPSIHLGDGVTISSGGNSVTQERSVSNFDKVDLRSMGNITITQGEEESLTITADENIIDHLTSNVSNNELILSTEDNYTFNNIGEIHYDLKVKDLSRIKLSGFGNIDMDGLTTDSLDVRLSGSGNFKMQDLTADQLDLVISGFGSADVSGTVPTEHITITGSGNYDGGDLQSQVADITVSGFGSATVWANENLKVTLTGSGNVDYYGSPTLEEKITGFGNLNNKGDK